MAMGAVERAAVRGRCLTGGFDFGALTTISGTLVEGLDAGGADAGGEFCCADAGGAATIANAIAKAGAAASRRNLWYGSFR